MSLASNALPPAPTGAPGLPGSGGRGLGWQAETAEELVEEGATNVRLAKSIRYKKSCQCRKRGAGPRLRCVEPKTAEDETLDVLLDAVRAGSGLARNRVLVQLRTHMLRAARGVLPHGFHGAEDAVQEAQRRCYQLIDSHACAIGLRRWACTIAKNEALRLLGRAARHVADPEALEKRLITHSLESNWANEGLRDVKRAADEATDDDQAVLVTLALQWGHAETAQHLGIPVGSVSGRVRAVRVRLARRLELVEVALALTTSISIDGNLDANDAGRQ